MPVFSLMMSMLNQRLIMFSMLILIAGTAHASAPMSMSPSSSTIGACIDASTSCAQGVVTSSSSWREELEDAESAQAACQVEIDAFCDGVQVGEGRIEKCLKANQKKLSKSCKEAQGLK